MKLALLDSSIDIAQVLSGIKTLNSGIDLFILSKQFINHLLLINHEFSIKFDYNYNQKLFFQIYDIHFQLKIYF